MTESASSFLRKDTDQRVVLSWITDLHVLQMLLQLKLKKLDR